MFHLMYLQYVHASITYIVRAYTYASAFIDPCIPHPPPVRSPTLRPTTPAITVNVLYGRPMRNFAVADDFISRVYRPWYGTVRALASLEVASRFG
jgi:hypothetical protein